MNFIMGIHESYYGIHEGYRGYTRKLPFSYKIIDNTGFQFCVKLFNTLLKESKGFADFKQSATPLLKENHKYGFQNSILIKGFFSKHKYYISKVIFKIDRKSSIINSLQAIEIIENRDINVKITNERLIIKIVKK